MAAHLGGSLSRTIAESILAAQAAGQPHLQAGQIEHLHAIAQAINTIVKPHVEAITGTTFDHLLIPSAPATASANPTAPPASGLSSGSGQGQTTAGGAGGQAFRSGIWSDMFNAIMLIVAFAGSLKSVFGSMSQILMLGPIQEFYSAHPDVVLAPADLADMVERNILTMEQAIPEAAQSGLNMDRFKAMVLDTGEPPGIAEMLALWRRGDLSTATLEDMIAYSRIRTNWTPQVERLAYTTMSEADAITAVLKGIVSELDGLTLFQAAGGLTMQTQAEVDVNIGTTPPGNVQGIDQFGILLAAAGNPIGVMQSLNLLNHGLIDESQARDVIRHSRINPQFEDMALLLRQKWLGVIQIELALKGGTVSGSEATTWLLQEGYPVDQVSAFVQGLTSGKVQKHKDVTESAITKLYEAHMIPYDEALVGLGNVGYSGQEAQFILELSDATRIMAQTTAAVGKVHLAYLARRISESEVRSELASLDVPGAAQDDYLIAWNIERDVQFKSLTMAEVGAAVKKGYITVTDAEQRWSAMGYVAIDIALLVAEYTGVPPPGSPAALYKP